MTAEVIVMNKAAIALAADSAVTFQRGATQKIYNTANKLFALSKYHPVGIMVYGSGEFMGVPWETIIKTYRAQAGQRRFDALEGYARDFIAYMELETQMLFPDELQRTFVRALAEGYFELIVKEINERIKAALDLKPPLSDADVIDIASPVVAEHYHRLSQAEFITGFSEEDREAILNKYGEEVASARDSVFEKLSLSTEASEQLAHICSNLLCKNFFPDDMATGVVIAGFGDSEIFPSAITYSFELVINNKLRYSQIDHTKAGHANSATIIPFAQGEMVSTFMDGIDPEYSKIIHGYMQELLQHYPDSIASRLKEIAPDIGDQFVEDLRKAGSALLTDFQQKIAKYRADHHVAPILDAVGVLPKDELAAMAESLVNLTSFKRKVSLQSETVGGPIDVAVISKGDGLVWIKRKHYFDPALNHSFFANYYRQHEDK